ncbi:MAG: endo-1,4-beta-xylanase [Roseburia sp.]
MKAGKVKKKMLALLLAGTAVFGLPGGGAMQVRAAGQNTAYVDTSGYELLDELYEDYFLLGAACQAIDHWNDPTAEIGNKDKEKLLSAQFNSMTFGNEFKPAYNFDSSSDTLFQVDFAAEELLNWAKENGMKVRGHVLVWHSQVDPSIFATDYQAYSDGKITRSDTAKLDEECLVDREELLERLKRYIYGVLEYTYQNGYADIIYAWDVVNEAADESQPDGLRRSYWYQIIGPDYLYYAFLYAREAETLYAKQYASLYGLDADKDDLSSIEPKLFYNDYNEWFGTRSDAIVRFLTEEPWNENHEKVTSDVINPEGDGTIYGDGLLDGIGMQGHLDDTQSIEQYMTALEKYNAAVPEIHITELDVGRTGTDANADYYQAKFYYEFFSRLIEEVKDGVNLTSVTLWGLTDDASWRRDSNPLLFNGDLSKKPAFEAMVMAAKGEEFSLTPEKITVEAKDLYVTFEPYKEDGKTKTVTPQDIGAVSRGSGHQSVITIVNEENHTEGAAIGFSLRVRRNEQDATMKMDVSSYIGKTINITAFAKTQDKKLRMGLDTAEPKQLAEQTTSEDWVELSAVCTIPEELNSAYLYFETDGNADFYLDDISIVCQDEEALSTESGNANEEQVQSNFSLWEKIKEFFARLFH